MKILITGATGFIGGPTLKVLAAGEHELFALCRSQGSAAGFQGQATCALGDLEDPASLRRIVAEVQPEVVVHLAARIASTRSDAALHRVNAEGTRGLLDAALAAKVRRFVFASTVVTGDAGGRVLREDVPLPVTTSYGRSKQYCERLLLDQRDNLEVVILRPSHVYGPGGWFAGVVRDHARGRFLIPGDGRNLWDLVHVDDVAQALALAVTAPAPSAVYHVVDDTPKTFNEVLELVSEALGRRPPRHAPVWLARLVAGRNAVDAAIRSARSCNAKLRSELGWVPRYPDAAVGIPGVVRAIMGAGG